MHVCSSKEGISAHTLVAWADPAIAKKQFSDPYTAFFHLGKEWEERELRASQNGATSHPTGHGGFKARQCLAWTTSALTLHASLTQRYGFIITSERFSL